MQDTLNLNRLLLLTSAPLKGSGIGTLYLRTLIDGAPEISLHWKTEEPFFLGQNLSRFGKVGRLLRSILARFRLWQILRLYLFKNIFLPFRMREIERSMSHLGLHRILLTTSSPELIALGLALVNRGHNLLVIVWDAPEYLAQNLRLGHNQSMNIMHDFNELMEKVQAAAVVSDEMYKQYRESYDVPCVIMRHGTAAITKIRPVENSDEIKIIFAGSLYAKSEWNAFVAALELADWKLANRPVRLIYLGQFPLAGADRPDRMEYFPSVEHTRALEVMAGMNIGYLPYWIDTSHEIAARTSFPGKLTSYAAAGLDIFHHGPECSSVTQFLNEYPFGLACHSLDPAIIHSRLEQLASITGSPVLTEARRCAMQNELSDSAMITSFRRLLNLNRASSLDR